MFTHLTNKIWIFVFCFSLTNYLFAQEINKLDLQVVSNDTTKIESEKKYKLELAPHFKAKSPLLSLGKAYDPFVETFEFVIPPYIKEDNKKQLNFAERQRIRNEINQAMKVYRDGKLKNDLGVVGQILGYSQTAAVVGLAIYHIHKYGFK